MLAMVIAVPACLSIMSPCETRLCLTGNRHEEAEAIHTSSRHCEDAVDRERATDRKVPWQRREETAGCPETGWHGRWCRDAWTELQRDLVRPRAAPHYFRDCLKMTRMRSDVRLPLTHASFTA
jgi:hypothetical protein